MIVIMKNLLDRIINNNINKMNLGTKAAYIPALKNVPDKLGIAVTTEEGIFYSGDANHKFTFQSMSKIISLIIALEDNGFENVFNIVGMEPSGDSFNSFSKLEFNYVIKPSNPFINVGAILVVSMIKGASYSEKIKKLIFYCKNIFQREDITFNEEVYYSERENANRNRALAYLLKEKGLLNGNVEEILDYYFRLCSMEVSCIDLANLGHFLSFNNKDCSVKEKNLQVVKTLMLTCGMYDYSGEFAVRIGMPSKSGVSGGIVSCAPRNMGIGVFCPNLDQKGNSILGIKMLEELNKELNLNIFR
jgi:glutaminase